MRKAFPAIRPYQTHSLAVTAPHVLYVEESGNPEGIPVLFVHGGPGGGTRTSDRCFFDPEKYRIILFDQRGSGQSTPHARLEDNNTAALIEDIETIRNYGCHLDLEILAKIKAIYKTSLDELVGDIPDDYYSDYYVRPRKRLGSKPR